jgi:hypothetical protein
MLDDLIKGFVIFLDGYSKMIIIPTAVTLLVIVGFSVNGVHNYIIEHFPNTPDIAQT